jgi:hypothetical protein
VPCQYMYQQAYDEFRNKVMKKFGTEVEYA